MLERSDAQVVLIHVLGCCWTQVAGVLLQQLVARLGEEATRAEWQTVGLELKQFLPSFERDDQAALEKIISSYGIGAIV